MKKIKIPDIIIHLFIGLYALFCIVPILLTFMVSITSEESIIKNGYSLIPEKLSINAYKLMLNSNADISIIRSYLLSIFVTLIGTMLAVLITAMAAYTLSNKNVKYRNALGMYFFITMIFSAGIVPWYMMCKTLGLRNNIFALIIPNLIFNPFNLFLVRGYMDGIPDSLRESARIDGANDALIAFKIYFPLSKPALATVGLFYGIAYWNDWWNAIMLVDKSRLYPIQYLLLLLKSQISMINQLNNNISIAKGILPSESLKMATAVVTIGPIVLLYPFLQKYFVKGLTIGSVKG